MPSESEMIIQISYRCTGLGIFRNVKETIHYTTLIYKRPWGFGCLHQQVKDKTDEEKAKEFEEYFGCQAISVESVEDRCLLLCYSV